jgi:hypothetical protein
MANKAGGGPRSKNVRNVKAPKIEPRVNGVDVNSLGKQKTFKSYDFARPTKGYTASVGPTNNQIQGPGAGRDVHRSGSQQGLKPAPGNGTGRDILSEFSPKEGTK